MKGVNVQVKHNPVDVIQACRYTLHTRKRYFAGWEISFAAMPSGAD